MRCRMYDFVYTTDLGVILLLYRQDRHRTRWSELRPTPAKLVVEKGGIPDVGLYVSWVVAALGPENVLTNLTRGRSARPRKCLNLT